MKHARTVEAKSLRLFTVEEVRAIQRSTFAEGYDSGAENTQLEVRRRPFLIQLEAVDQWLSQHSI